MTTGLDGYLGAVVGRLQSIFGGRLVGVYPAGSVALDAYIQGRSDVDLVAVASGFTVAEVEAVVAALDHDALPCPARGLEFVLYDRSVLAGLTTEAGFALNLNTGAGLPYKAEIGYSGGPAFWYPIDRDIVRQQRRALLGPPFPDLMTRVRYRELLPVVAESVASHRAFIGDHGVNAVLNGCRALRYFTERTWYPKRAAAAWALDRLPSEAPVVQAALDDVVDRSAAADFLAKVHAIVTTSR
ncbi:aminoglycoside adenylyltransferase domain-containing protein [Dactylosporangium sp. NPDC051541]|uniref:aminoglycoside adenylyltransferase domain-containing protein n=1 Tax=Dactylosporangium sp. NPDC051541 TaxID=3363977 RepID=UPI0037AF8988